MLCLQCVVGKLFTGHVGSSFSVSRRPCLLRPCAKLLAAVGGGGMLLAVTAPAATLTWGANTTTASVQDGGGTWITGGTASNANWSNGTTNQNWTSTSTAVFGAGGTSGSVGVASTIYVGGLIFNQDGTRSPAASSSMPARWLSSFRGPASARPPPTRRRTPSPATAPSKSATTASWPAVRSPSTPA